MPQRSPTNPRYFYSRSIGLTFVYIRYIRCTEGVGPGQAITSEGHILINVQIGLKIAQPQIPVVLATLSKELEFKLDKVF
ncbi:MAG: hypothetical protein CMQ21_15070 [Gammaproteobacteria bacterium]|nr:hypothetical protein [Gammaproteobacteria bacterium]